LIFFFTSFFVEGHVFVLIEHKPDSIIVFETFTEFAIEFADRLEEGGGDRSKSGGAFGTNAALGDGKEETGEGIGGVFNREGGRIRIERSVTSGLDGHRNRRTHTERRGLRKLFLDIDSPDKKIEWKRKRPRRKSRWRGPLRGRV
jgi:hypothetical protein